MKWKVCYTDTQLIINLVMRVLDFVDKELEKLGVENPMHRRMVLRLAMDILILSETADLAFEKFKEWVEEKVEGEEGENKG